METSSNNPTSSKPSLNTSASLLQKPQHMPSRKQDPLIQLLSGHHSPAGRSLPRVLTHRANVLSTPPLFHTFVLPSANRSQQPGRGLCPKHQKSVSHAPVGTGRGRRPETHTTVLRGNNMVATSSKAPCVPMEKNKSMRGSPVLLLPLASRRAPMVIPLWREVGETHKKATMSVPPASVPFSATWRRTTHGRWCRFHPR